MNLKVFTANYPYGFGESFLNNEIPYLVDEFDSVSIFPFESKETRQKVFSFKVEVIENKEGYQHLKLTLKDKLFMMLVMMFEWTHCDQKLFFARKSRFFFSMLKVSMKRAKWLESYLEENDALYSCWMNEWSLALALLKKQGKIERFAFRVNGYDIWNERCESNYMPFRYFNYSQASRVIPLSKSSEVYLKALNIFPEKVNFSYFGTPDFGTIEPISREDFVIFSCSNAIPLKRLDKMAQAISKLTFKTKWVHHGDGQTIADISSFMEDAPPHIKFVHSSKKEDYHEVLEMERNLAPDLFINLSTTEGLPVTLMEAISMGIPLLVNDVGSCGEFITEDTGMMLDPDASIKEVTDAIVEMKERGKMKYQPNKIKQFWRENFSAEKNYRNFAKNLKSVFK